MIDILNLIFFNKQRTQAKLHYFQESKAKREIKLKISNRPNSILMESTYLAASGSELKFPNELTSPKPGPTLPMVAMEAEKAVIKSIFMAERIMVTASTINR